MTAALVVLAVVAAWCGAAVLLAFGLGRVIARRDRSIRRRD